MRFLPGVFLLLSTLAHAAVPEYEALRAARPDGRVVTVRELALKRDAFTLRFHEGAFHFLAPAGEATFGAVFLGMGSFTLHPVTEAERKHLGLITRERDPEVLGDQFTELVLLFTDRTADEIVAHAAAAEAAPDARAVAAAWYLSAPEGEASNGRGKAALRFADAEHYAIRTKIARSAIEGNAFSRSARPGVHASRAAPARCPRV